MLFFGSPYSESIEFDKSIDSHNKSREFMLWFIFG